MAKYLISILLLLSVFSSASVAVTSIINPTNAIVPPKLEFLKNYKGTNQIKILNNRFRVDYHVDEVMMLFFRKNGSRPVVLIKPDGSKIYPRDANAKTIEWHAEQGYDLIKLKEPMPGPWQAVGRILPDSKILVLSDIELQADPLPNEMFQFELIKSEARIINAREVITDRNFKDVIKLKANLYPTSDPDAENFGSDIFRVGEFLDDGKGLDEKPRDGVFTLEYYINTAHGEWFPKYRVIAELFTRELDQEGVNILPSPISFVVHEATGEERYHYVDIVAQSDAIEEFSLLFQGEVIYPNMDKETFSIEGKQERRLKIFNGEYGTFRINSEVFGTMKDGREFRLKIPTYQFLTIEPDEPETTIDLPDMTEMQSMPEDVEPEQQEPEFPVVLVIVINVVILAFGFLIIWLLVLKKSIPNPFAKLFKKKAAKEPEVKIKEEKKEKEEAPKASAPPPVSDDILDLSLPDD